MNIQDYNTVPDFLGLQALDEIKQEYLNGLPLTDAVVRASNVVTDTQTLGNWIQDIQNEKMQYFNLES